MSTPEARKIDRTNWGRGPWDGEPDRLDFRAEGFPCLLLRTPTGHWCGYVGVPPGHPLHGKGYDEDGVEVEVHGGLTYANACSGPICHVPEPGEPDAVWWFGFDCAHSGDLSPELEAFRRGQRHATGADRYRTVDYVRRETERLARQLREAAT